MSDHLRRAFDWTLPLLPRNNERGAQIVNTKEMIERPDAGSNEDDQ